MGNKDDIVFMSNLSEEEIAKNFQDMDLFSGIMSGLDFALAYEKGCANATKAEKISQESATGRAHSVHEMTHISPGELQEHFDAIADQVIGQQRGYVIDDPDGALVLIPRDWYDRDDLALLNGE